eukprot:TRINITY_DN22856_c0_g1_i2.p1 TRINITY_DN22856_c0_g1~~TRINITY_DN22856_c0_g1_i2.p1  ORF type:complete len:427 (+),score=59.58 TRINITY_DN22856_c0_g1_i2:180-1283(+)
MEALRGNASSTSPRQVLQGQGHKLQSLRKKLILERVQSSYSRVYCQQQRTQIDDKLIVDNRSKSGVILNGKEKEEQQLQALKELQKEEDIEQSGEWVAFWVGSAALFAIYLFWSQGGEKAEEFVTGYVLEQSLSVDNLMVFILIFDYFKTPKSAQARCLTVGIASAAVLRLVMIVLGVEIVESFKPALLVFALILIFSSYKLLQSRDEEEEDLSQNWMVNYLKKVIEVSDNYDGDRFITVQNGIRMATPLLLALTVVELSDVLFAVDSIPAIFGVTLDPFIVYSSNMLAILSLRALYGFVSIVVAELKYLEKAVALVLGFIGTKLSLDFVNFHISTEISLVVVALTLAGGVLASYIIPEEESQEPGS